jgi:hypothetical protein
LDSLSLDITFGSQERKGFFVMFSKVALKATAAAAGIATAGIVVAAPALADPQAVAFGQSAEIPGAAGAGAIDYTVGAVQPSGHNDGVWFSDVVAKGVSGSPTPNIADFNARAVNSSTYAVMKGNEPDGLPNGPLAPGTQVTGRLYFNVRGGTAPDSVVYRDAGGTEKVVWKS